MPDDDDRKVKDLIDAVTQRELERWFGLPSFEQVAEQEAAAPPAEADPEMQAVIERREKALAAVDPGLLDSLYGRLDRDPNELIRFQPSIDVQIDDSFGAVDPVLVERASSIAEPREYELSDELKDDMRECTPQALLRDLHRAEIDFDKTFEVVDFAAEQRLDIVAEVKSAMATRWSLPPLDASPFVETRRLLDQLRSERGRPWIEYLPALRNRTVRE